MTEFMFRRERVYYYTVEADTQEEAEKMMDSIGVDDMNYDDSNWELDEIPFAD